MPRLLQVVHGFPPHQNAGTEQYAARVAAGLRQRGWSVHTVTATFAPGASMYSLQEEPGITRIVNNTPFRGLRQAESDPIIDRILEQLQQRLKPDVIHLQHVQFLSATLPLLAPTVWTLHDAWGWCPAGGLLLQGGHPCAGPSAACATCAGDWAQAAPAVDRALKWAGYLDRIIPAAKLHQLWKRLPARVRSQAQQARPAPIATTILQRRDLHFRALAARCQLISPSQWLAERAHGQGWPKPLVLPHGVEPQAPGTGEGPFVFLGTLAPHKGPALVYRAWQQSGVTRPLRIHGPPGGDAAYLARFPHHGIVSAAEVPRVLAQARALVVGSIWPENAPLVVLEARSVGCPVIAPAIGGLPELVTPGVDGWLYPAGDISALAEIFKEAERFRPTPRPPLSFAAHLDRLEVVYKNMQSSS